MPPHADEDCPVQRGVGLTVAAAVEPVAAVGLAGRRSLGRRVDSRYPRTLADAPISGQRVGFSII